MKAILRLVAWVVALAAPTGAILFAQQAAPQPAPGRVLVLDNEHLIEGEVTRHGEMFKVHRQDGSELTMPASKTVMVCASMEEAYRFVCTRHNLHDPDEHVRLARWCLMNEMRDQAIVEVKLALEMRPNHAESRQLLMMLQSATTTVAPQPPSPLPAVVETGPLLDVCGECLALFTTKVQPILMNTCASCHATGHGGSFHLVRSTEAGSRMATQQNLTAVIKQICFEEPSGSPLLSKASCGHGGALTPPLAGTEAVPFATLRGWTNLVVVNHPQLRAHGAKAVASGDSRPAEAPANKPDQTPPVARAFPTPEPEPTAAPPTARVVAIEPGVVPASPEAPVSNGPGTAVQPRPLPQVQAPVEIRDEFDPEIFNRQNPHQ
jgi:hypothetical protein